MLDLRTFKVVIKNTHLVSINVCSDCNNQLLLDKRNNEALKERWLTPGGRIYKNESRQAALQRIWLDELGLSPSECAHFELIGIRDHFHPSSAPMKVYLPVMCIYPILRNLKPS